MCTTSPTTFTSALIPDAVDNCTSGVQVSPSRRHAYAPSLSDITAHHLPFCSQTFDCGFSPVDAVTATGASSCTVKTAVGADGPSGDAITERLTTGGSSRRSDPTELGRTRTSSVSA